MFVEKEDKFNLETYLELDIKNNLHNVLTQEEFSLFRIFKFIKVNLKDSLDSKKLYIIPNNKINNTYLKELNFKKIPFTNGIIFNNNSYLIMPESRIMNIHIKNKTIIRFIYNSIYLQKVLDDLGVTSFFITLNRDSNVSVNDVNSIFIDKSINDIYSDDRPRILCLDNYKKRFNENIDIIEDISPNSKIYFEYSSKKKFIYSETYNKYPNEIIKFILSEAKILFFFGQRKNSKTVFFNLLPRTTSILGITSTYFNVRVLDKLNNMKEIKKLLYYEFLNLAANEKEIEKVYEMKLFHKLIFSKSIVLINDIVKDLIKKYNDNFCCKYSLIIIDDLYLEENDEFIMNNIIDLIKNNNKFKLIISGEGKFFFNKIKEYFSYKLTSVYLEDVIFFELNDNKIKNTIFPADSVEDNIKEEIEYLKKYKAQELIYAICLDGKELNLPQFLSLNFLVDLPNYFKIYFTDDPYPIKFSVENKIFSIALNKSTYFNINKSELELIMSRKSFPRNIYGISEELLIILLLKYNKFNIKNLMFIDKFVIEIKEINDIKNKMIGKFFKKLDYFENVLILQEKYNGANFDLLIIQSLQKHRYAIFVQIGVDKNLEEIKTHYYNLKNNKYNYIKNLEKYFGCKIDEITLLYIFDEDTQKEKGPNVSSGSKICQRHNINYLFYSFNDRALKTYDNDKFYSINGGYYVPDFMFNKINI